MDMQDKDFDKLFSSKFEDFEAEPSPRVWENIADELGGKKGTRSWIAYLSIAATIAVVFTASWLLLQQDSQPDKHHNYANLISKDTAKSVTPAVTVPIAKQPEPLVINKTSVDRVASNSGRQPKKTSPVIKVIAPVKKADDVVNGPEPVSPNKQLVAQTVTLAPVVVKPVMPDVQLTPKTIDVIAATPVEKPVDMASTEKEPEEPVKKRGIHNLGGLINVLVAKVDKRPNKFIEFSDDEDDNAETSVTGVNIGPLKIKKQ